MRNTLTFIATAIGLAALAPAQVTLGQLDDFQDGTFQNWTGGDSMQNMPDGGPNGAGDRFLWLQSFGGGGGGSRLATFNDNQWTGDYFTAGVTHVTVDMINLGDVDLEMRLVAFDFSTADTRWTSTVAHTLAVGSGWQRLTFSIQEADLTRVQGEDSYADLIVDVDRLMFRHDAGAPSARGTAIASVMGIDNVRAAVPEPASLLVLGLGAAFLRRRKK